MAKQTQLTYGSLKHYNEYLGQHFLKEEEIIIIAGHLLKIFIIKKKYILSPLFGQNILFRGLLCGLFYNT